MRIFFNTFKSELIKSKGSYIFLSSIGVSIFICGLYFLLFFFKHEDFASMGTNPWMTLAHREFNTLGLLFPFYLMLVAYLINSIEHRSNSWKYIYTLPSPKMNFYFSKLLLLVLSVFLSISCAYIFTMFSGWVLSHIRPDIGFQDYNSNHLIFQYFAMIFIAALPILFLQFAMSIIWGNFFRSVGLGFFMYISCIIFMSWEKNYYLAYSFMFILSSSFYEMKLEFFQNVIIMSIIYSVVFITIGYFLVKRLETKNIS